MSFPNIKDKEERYINSVIKEIQSQNWDEINKNYQITTIYIGGGTPSFIDAENIKKVLDIFQDKIGIDFNNIEITIEVNPGTVNAEKLRVYKNAEINRISIGLQTTNNNLLKQIGRIHTFEQFLEIYNMAKEAGFDNINVDLMIGLPNQTIDDLKQSLEKVLELQPNHISVYSLILEEGTPLFNMVEKGALSLPDEETERQMYWYVKNKLELAGYNHYEISNFAKPGNESKHNLNCWNQEEYIGFGLAAHSYFQNKRYSNTTDIDKYIKYYFLKSFDNLKEKKMIQSNTNNEISLSNNSKQNPVKEIHETQIIEDKKKEYMLLGLRKIEGVSISKFKEKYVDNPIYLFKDELAKLTEQELVEIDGDFIRLTNKGLDFANLVWEEFVD